MLSLNNLIALETNDDSRKVIFEAKYLVEQHITFSLSVVSGIFSGKAHFCSSVDEIKRFAYGLQQIYSQLGGNSKLLDYDSDAFILFQTIDPYGHLEVSGQVGSSIDDHYMIFKFLIDQTMLLSFTEDFREMLKGVSIEM